MGGKSGNVAGMGGALGIGKMAQQYAPMFWGYGTGMQQQYALPIMNEIMHLLGYSAGTAPGVFGPRISTGGTEPVQVGTSGGQNVYYQGGTLYTGDPSTGMTMLPQKKMGKVQWSPGYGYSMTGTAGQPLSPEEQAKLTPFESRLFQPMVTQSAQQAQQAKQQIAEMQNLGPAAREMLTSQVDIGRMGMMSQGALQTVLGLLGAPLGEMGSWQAGMQGATSSMSVGSQAYSSAMQASIQAAQMSGNQGMLSGLYGISALSSMIQSGIVPGALNYLSSGNLGGYSSGGGWTMTGTPSAYTWNMYP